MWISSNHDESYSHPGLQWAIFSLFEWWQEAFFDPFVRFDKLVIRSKSFRVVDFLNSPRFFFTITWKVELEGNENELFYEYWGKEKTKKCHILKFFVDVASFGNARWSNQIEISCWGCCQRRQDSHCWYRWHSQDLRFHERTRASSHSLKWSISTLFMFPLHEFL